MVVTTTTAAALAAGSTLGGFSGARRSEALFVISAAAGVMMIAAGVLRLGRYTRFVSVSVLTGFLTGVPANIVLGQLGGLLGSPQKGSPAIAKACNVITHPSDVSLTAAAVGVSTLVLIVVLSRTRVASVASLIALLIPTLASLGAGSLARVEDSGRIPSGLPMPHLPHLSLLSSLDLIAGAAAVAVIPTGSDRAVVVLRMRGRSTLGATGAIVLSDYANRLRSAGGHLFLSGVALELLQQLQKTHRVDLRDAVTVVAASVTILGSTQKAYHDAEAWLASRAASREAFGVRGFGDGLMRCSD